METKRSRSPLHLEGAPDHHHASQAAQDWENACNARIEKSEDSFSLADYINDSTEDQADLSLPHLSLPDVSLPDVSLRHVGDSLNAGGLAEDSEEETDDLKTLKLLSTKEACRRLECRRRLLLEYAHKIELAQVTLS